MKMRKLGSGFGSRGRTMAVEPLEGRAMLAGNVSVSVSGGSLIVRGDNAANGVFISQIDDGVYAVTGFDLGTGSNVATKINGSANDSLVFKGVTGDVNVDLKNGNDLLGIGNSPDDLAALAEECGFQFGLGDGNGGGGGEDVVDVTAAEVTPVEGRFFVPRNLIVNTGNGHDGIAVLADVHNSAIINTGSGDDAVAFGNLFDSENDITVGNDLVVLTGSGNDEVCAHLVTVNGLINVQTGDGNDGVEIHNFDAGAVLALTGNGIDFVGLSTFDTDNTVVVNTGGGNDTVFLHDFSAGQGFGPKGQKGAGYVTVVTGAGNDNAELTYFEADGVVVDTGAGNDGTPSGDSPITVAFADITNYLTVVTGAGNDLVNVGFVQTENMVIDTGAGNDGTADFPVAIASVDVDNLTIVTGAGNDNVYVQDGSQFQPSAAMEDDNFKPNTISNSLVVNTGAGNDIVQIIEQQVGRDLTVVLGAGNDQAAIGLDDEIGAGQVTNGMSVGHNLLVDAGAGNDRVGVGDIEILNDLFAFLGAGNDQLFAFNAEVGGNALFDAGAGNDDVALIKSVVKGNTTIFMGSGNDTLTVAGSSGKGRFAAYGGPGRDTFDNDLGITGNGSQDDVEIREFEVFTDSSEID